MSEQLVGWTRTVITDLADARSDRIDENTPRFEVFVRKRERATLTSNLGGGKQSKRYGKSNLPYQLPFVAKGVCADQKAFDGSRSLFPMGPQNLRPCDRASGGGDSAGSVLSFSDLKSVQAMGTGREGMIIGFDTEFTTRGKSRMIDSYQFATPDALDPSVMVEVVILPLTGHRISLHTALWEVVKAAGLWASPLVRDEVTALGVPKTLFWCDDPRKRWEDLAKFRVPVVIACHYGSADLTAFRRDSHCVDHMRRLTSAAGGLVTLYPFRMRRSMETGNWWQALSVTVRDTMSQAPAGHKTLASLGESCGVPKLTVPDDWIEDMTGYREAYLADFLEYGVNDAVIVVEYLARVWGDGVIPPVTLSGGAASAVVASGHAHFGVGSNADFRRAFSGVVMEDQGLDVIEEEDKLTFYSKRGLVPVDGAAGQVINAFAWAYHGGLNSCPMPGYYPKLTHDIDARNAYPTAMASLVDVDWERGVIEDVVHERELTPDDIPSANTPFVGFVTFTFPEAVAHPCIPVVAGGTLLFPRTSEGSAGTWACAPELYLALKLGAAVFCQIGYRARVLDVDGEPSRFLRYAVKQLIEDRSRARKVFGKGSLEEQILKTGVNSVYGKAGQDVAGQRSWDAFNQEMEAVGGSSITSSYHAAMATSLCRAQLSAAMNEIVSAGGDVYSVTTDGFISDWDSDRVEALDLYGIGDLLRDSREYLASDPSIWEAKHHQRDLVNFTTRGNVSLEPDGVCAHNGLRVPEGVEEDSYEDRLYLLEAVVTRDGKIPDPYKRFPSFRELSRVEGRRDFIPSTVNRALRMDYDLKRKPIMETMEPRIVTLPDGSEHEVATFNTEPWDSIEDCLRGREIARQMGKTGCLRTVDQWREWSLRFEYGEGRRIVTPQRAVLMSIVMAHRQEVKTIPALKGRKRSVEEKLKWLEQWGLGTVSRSDWDNARRPERVSQMLPLEELEPYLSRMIEAGE